MAGLGAEEIDFLLDQAELHWQSSRSPGLNPRSAPLLSVANLILEPSTRTRCSFEIAEKRLGVEHISLQSGEALSLEKGETLLDTARTIAAMGVNMLVIRHPEVGAPAAVAEAMPGVHVVNAGDGIGEHPTQGLIDLLTLRRRWGSLEGRRILIVGDIAHSRVARSDYHGLMTLGAEVVLCGPDSLLPDPGEFAHAVLTSDLDAALPGCDAIMALRIQRERLSTVTAAPAPEAYRRSFGITSRRLRDLDPDIPVLHPGPFNRGVEIDGDVADGERSMIWEQVRTGVAVRMAVLEVLARFREAHPAIAHRR